MKWSEMEKSLLNDFNQMFTLKKGFLDYARNDKNIMKIWIGYKLYY